MRRIEFSGHTGLILMLPIFLFPFLKTVPQVKD